MPYYNALLDKSIIRKSYFSHLPEHFLQRSGGDLGVVCCKGILFRKLCTNICMLTFNFVCDCLTHIMEQSCSFAIKASAALRPPFKPKETTPQQPLGRYF